MENSSNFEKKKIPWSKWAFIVGTPLGIIAIWLTIWAVINSASFIKFFSATWGIITSSWTIITLLIVILLFCIGWYIRKLSNSLQKTRNEYKEIMNKLNETNSSLTKILDKAKPSITRWEKINEIKFGSLQYPPMLDFAPISNEPIGIGIDILTKIFEKKLKRQHEAVTWENLNKALYEKDNKGKFKIDIIATPILETNERSKDLSFSLPIFYSEIGLYYNCADNRFEHLTPLSFEHAKNFINRLKNEDLFCYCIEGELSQRLANKHFKDKQIIPTDHNTLSIQSLLETVIDDSIKSDIVFAETYQAEQLIQMKISNGCPHFKNLKNILTPKQLLYPVVFALRKEDYVLKNYINLKLIEIDGPGSGIIELIKISLNGINNNFSKLEENSKEKFINDFFIREYQHLA